MRKTSNKSCTVRLLKDAAKDMGSKFCGALYQHHHCKACNWPISDETNPDKEYCGACANVLEF